MATFSDILKDRITVEADSTDYMLNKYRPRGFSYEQIITMALARQRSKENSAFEIHEHCFAKKQYSSTAMFAIFDIIEMGYNPDDYIVLGMNDSEIYEVKTLLEEKEKQKLEGIRSRIESLKKEVQSKSHEHDGNKSKETETER